MKQNSKFLALYIAILFSFALILIIFAGLTQNNYRKEIEQQASESAGVKKSLVTLTDENEELRKKEAKLNSQIEALQGENEKLSGNKEILVKAMGGDETVTQILIDAYGLCLQGKAQEAINAVSGIDASTLTTAQAYIYNTIIGE